MLFDGDAVGAGDADAARPRGAEIAMTAAANATKINPVRFIGPDVLRD